MSAEKVEQITQLSKDSITGSEPTFIIMSLELEVVFNHFALKQNHHAAGQTPAD